VAFSRDVYELEPL